jgi:hypothetical protein
MNQLVFVIYGQCCMWNSNQILNRSGTSCFKTLFMVCIFQYKGHFQPESKLDYIIQCLHIACASIPAIITDNQDVIHTLSSH